MLDFTTAHWTSEPAIHTVSRTSVSITTEPETDFWQRTYYGFRNNNAPALLLDHDDNFTFTAKASFTYQALFDQCGLIIHLDQDNWFKASIEYENAHYSRLGSVVTNSGYSDWATTDIDLPGSIWYRLHRRGPDFLIEASVDGLQFKQMRIFHLHALGHTSEVMGRTDPPISASCGVKFGVYACSPTQSSFVADFSDMYIEPCLWKAHKP